MSNASITVTAIIPPIRGQLSTDGAGAGIDVFADEPLPLNHPLRSIENVVLSPHTASMVPEATLAGLAMSVDNIASFIHGHTTNVVKTTT